MTTPATKTPERAMTAGEDPKSLKGMLGQARVKARFDEILGKKAPAFISSIISAYQTNQALQKVSPESIIGAAAVAASLDLPINPNLGQAAIVPYDGVAQFQMMWKGYVQLAHRTGKYKRMNLARVYDGELVSHDRFSGKVVLDAAKKKSDRVQGYYFTFELTNGYTHESYWSATQCIEHGWKYSKSFRLYNKGQWIDDPLLPKGKDGKISVKDFAGFLTEKSGTDAMCAKTIVKNELSKWGPLSTEMQTAHTFDQAAVKGEVEKGTAQAEYIDTTAEPAAGEGGGEDAGKMPQRASAATAKKEEPKPTSTPAQDGGSPADDRLVITVGSTAKTELDGKAVFVIKDMEGGKLYTDNQGVYTLAQSVEKDGARLAVDSEDRNGRTWIISAEALPKK